MKARLVFLALTACFVFHPSPGHAQWQPDGAPVCTIAGNQIYPEITADGSGGAIMVWYDTRNGGYDIYAQRVDASGVPQWTTDGVALCTATNSQYSPVIVGDGAGGAIVAWQDNRSGVSNIYAQRVNASGVPQWTADGVALCTAAGGQYVPEIVSDGAGGAIVTWYDYRSGVGYDVYAQRVDASGVVQWPTNGASISAATNDQTYPTIASDGAGGAIVTWQDYRSGSADIYAQRVSAIGLVQWTTNGIALSTATNNDYTPGIVSDDAGGAVVAWLDGRSGVSYDVYAQRVNGSGVAQWTANGVALCTDPNDQNNPIIASDGAGGAIVTWTDYRSGVSNDIYAQRVSASGAPQWTYNGVPLCTATNDQNAPRIASDGSGGAIVTWYDYRSGTSYDVYAQRVNAAGAVEWTADGVVLSAATGGQTGPMITPDGSGDAIVTWYDYRSGSGNHIYAQRVEGTYGYWGHPEPIVTSVADVPNDQGGHVAVNWDASGRDLPVPQTISYYTIWRAVDSVPASTAVGSPSIVTDLRQVREDAVGPVYYVTKSTSSVPGYYWELIGTQSAHGWPGYSFVANTRADSVLTNPSDEVFMVAAQIPNDDYVAFASNAMSGHSVDNLAPAAPLYLTAQRNGSEVDLAWNGVHVSDLKNYAIYRSDASGVTPIQTDFLADDADTVLVDSGAPLTSLYYIVTANDVHGNQSKPSNEASVSAATHVGNTPSLTALTVLQNRPNPFGAQTELEIGLPAASEIHLEVYDVAGHRVREEDVAGVRGWQEVRFAGLDDRGEPLASGMYFYKVAAHGETVTRKMLITR